LSAAIEYVWLVYRNIIGEIVKCDFEETSKKYYFSNISPKNRVGKGKKTTTSHQKSILKIKKLVEVLI